jgi:hypothetical protein
MGMFTSRQWCRYRSTDGAGPGLERYGPAAERATGPDNRPRRRPMGMFVLPRRDLAAVPFLQLLRGFGHALMRGTAPR